MSYNSGVINPASSFDYLGRSKGLCSQGRSNRARYFKSARFEVTGPITPWIVLHSVPLPIQIAPCKVIEDSRGCWISRCRFRMRCTGQVELGFRIAIVSGNPGSLIWIPDSGESWLPSIRRLERSISASLEESYVAQYQRLQRTISSLSYSI